MTTHSLLHTGVWGQTHLFIYLFEDWWKYVSQMSFLPENRFEFEMMDKAFAEKQEKERRQQGTGPDCVFQPNVAQDKVHPCIVSSLPFCISFWLCTRWQGNGAKSIISFMFKRTQACMYPTLPEDSTQHVLDIQWSLLTTTMKTFPLTSSLEQVLPDRQVANNEGWVWPRLGITSK